MPKGVYQRLTATERFVKKHRVDDNSGCWLWLDHTDSDGYARMTIDGKSIAMHRWSYEYFVGPIPDGFTVDHICHNRSSCIGGRTCRHRRCVNPRHLEAVLIQTNIRRGRLVVATKTRHAARTHCGSGHAMTPSNTYTKPEGGRRCRICMRARKNESTKRRRAA